MMWVNGSPGDSLSPLDRGLAYGDGLFETIRVKGGIAVRLSRHLARLSSGCERLGLAVDLDEARDEIERFSAGQNGVVKLIVTRGVGQRGYRPSPMARATRVLVQAPAPDYPASHAIDGIRLYPCQTRLAEQPLLAGLKHLNRLEQVLARAEWSSEAFAEGLMRDTSGRVIEGVFSNLMMIRKDQLITASLVRCGVAGVMRAEILSLAPSMGLSAVETDVTIDDFIRSDEIFLCNSLYGIWPVREWAGHDWPVGPVTRKLQAVLADETSAS